MAEIRLGPQDDDEEPEEVAEAADQLYVLEIMNNTRNYTYGPMSISQVQSRGPELLATLARSGTDVAVRVVPLVPWPE